MVTNLAPGEWLTYTVHVLTARAHHVEIHYAATGTGGSIRVAFGGTDVTADVAIPTERADWRSYG